MRCGCGPHVGSDGRSPVCVRDCPAVAVRTGASGFAQCVGAARPHLQSECRGIRAGDGERFVREVGAEELRFWAGAVSGPVRCSRFRCRRRGCGGPAERSPRPRASAPRFRGGGSTPLRARRSAGRRTPCAPRRIAGGVRRRVGRRSVRALRRRSEPRVGQQGGGGDARQLRDDREGDLACFALAVECEERVGDAADGLSAGAGCGRYVRVVHFRL